MYCDSTTTVTITDSTFSSNQSGSGGGGAIGFWNTKAVIRGSTFVGNTTLGAGGVMTSYAAPGQSIGIENSTFSGNSADYAGAFYAQLGTTDLRNMTITANSGKYGGGFYNPGGSTILLRNTIVAGNFSTQGSPDCEGAVISSGYNLIGSTDGCTGLVASDLTGTSASLGALANNGGPTQTHLPYAGSPAIDGGNPSGCVGLAGQNLTVDQRGLSRPFRPATWGRPRSRPAHRCLRRGAAPRGIRPARPAALVGKASADVFRSQHAFCRARGLRRRLGQRLLDDELV